jgi:hypothetical protein
VVRKDQKKNRITQGPRYWIKETLEAKDCVGEVPYNYFPGRTPGSLGSLQALKMSRDETILRILEPESASSAIIGLGRWLVSTKMLGTVNMLERQGIMSL